MTSGATPQDLTRRSVSPTVDAELARRLGQFRHELKTLTNPPTRSDLERLVDMAREFQLLDDTISEELAEIRASFEALELADQIARGDLPVVVSIGTLPDGECCHFVTPVRFGRRRSDQFGHLELTSGWLKYHGALDVSLAWSGITAVQRSGRDILVSLVDSRRLLRFCCHALSEAARATVVATYLANMAHTREEQADSPHHATL